jgi:hypothetical protein
MLFVLLTRSERRRDMSSQLMMRVARPTCLIQPGSRGSQNLLLWRTSAILTRRWICASSKKQAGNGTCVTSAIITSFMSSCLRHVSGGVS